MPSAGSIPLGLSVSDEEETSHGATVGPGGRTTLIVVPTLRLFAQARVSAGTGSDEVAGTTVDAVIAAAVTRYGSEFEAILPICKIWVNGDEASGDTLVGDGDEVAVLPPVSGGSS